MLRSLVLVGACVASFSAALAQDIPKSVLFIGNSFTLGSGNPWVVGDGGVPGLFQKMVAAKSADAIVVKKAAELKVDWSFHLADGSATRDAISSQPWDVVVMQEVSTAPGDYGEKPLEDFFEDGKKLAAVIRETSSDAKLVIFQPWSRAAKHSVYTGKFPGGPEEMQSVIDENIAKLAAEINAEVAPVGDAFLKCTEVYPDLNIYLEDFHHANAEGCYLAAAVFYAKLLNADPRGLPALAKVSEENAAKLQEIAWTVVSESNKADPAKK